MGFYLRRALERDVPVLQSLCSVLDADVARYQPQHFVRALRHKEVITRHLRDTDSVIFLLCAEREVCGFVHAQIQEPYDIGIIKAQRFVCIWDIVVREAHRGKGAGSMLLDAAKEWAKAQGAQYVRLNVLAENEFAMRFYEKHGFAPTQLTLEAEI